MVHDKAENELVPDAAQNISYDLIDGLAAFAKGALQKYLYHLDHGPTKLRGTFRLRLHEEIARLGH